MGEGRRRRRENAEEQGSRAGSGRFEPVWAGWGAARRQQLNAPPLQPGGRYSPARIARALGVGRRASAGRREMGRPTHAATGMEPPPAGIRSWLPVAPRGASERWRGRRPRCRVSAGAAGCAAGGGEWRGKGAPRPA